MPSSEPRPENPYPWKDYPRGDIEDCMNLRHEAFDEGFASRQPEIDRLRAERDEMIRVSAANIATTQRNMDALVAERDAAITAGQKLADAVARVCGEGHPALAAWRALPGCCDRPVPEGGTDD